MSRDILVVGYSGSGKTSLIDELIKYQTDQSVEPEVVGAVTKYCFTNTQDMCMTLYDTRSFGNLSKIKFQSVVKAIKEVNAVLICQKLYGRVDDDIVQMMKELSKYLKDDLINRSIFVFTFGDEYRIRCDDDNPIAHMRRHETAVKERQRDILIDNGVNEDIVNRRPTFITCAKRQGGDLVPIPTSEDWRKELCNEIYEDHYADKRKFQFPWILCSPQWLKYLILGLLGSGSSILGLIIIRSVFRNMCTYLVRYTTRSFMYSFLCCFVDNFF